MSDTSNKARGDANHQALVAYFDRVGADIPRKPDGSGDIAAIVRDVPLTTRQVIYQNERNRALCNERFARHDIPPIAGKGDAAAVAFQRPGAAAPDDEKKALKRHNDQLQRELAVARAEAIELRREMRRYSEIEIHLANTGRLPR